MAPQPTPPSLYSPDIQAWLMGLGPFPFGGSPVPLLPGSFGNEDEMDFMGDVLATQKKGNDVISDPAQITQFGTGTGGWSPDAFQPVISYEPVKAPGYMQMRRYLQSKDPFLNYVARRLDEGATAVQVETEIDELIRNGDQEMQAALPKVRVDPNMPGQQMKVPVIDWNRVGNITSGLEKAIIDDPEFNAYDPQSGLPANEIEEETEASRYFREMNLPNPYEKFSPDLLADQPTLDRENQVARVGKPRADREAQAASERYAMLVRQLEGMQGTPYGDATESGAAGRPRGASVINDLPSSALSVATTGQEADFLSDAQNQPGQAGMVYEPNIKTTTGRRTPSQAKAQDRSRTSRQKGTAGRTKLDAENQRTKMNNANQDDIYAQMERQRMIDAMTRAGYTPFNEVMRSRQSPIYGR